MFRKLAYSILAFALAVAPAYADAIVTGAIPNTFTPGSVISSSQMNANFQYIVSQVNANAAKNGANSSITSLSALSTPLAPAQGGSSIYIGGTATGTANAITVATATPNGFTLAAGNTIRFNTTLTNTGPTTLTVNGTTVTNVFKSSPSGPVALTGGEIVAYNTTEAFYDGVQYQLITHTTENGGYGPVYNLTNTTTADLGSSPSHFIGLQVNASITSLGASASLTYPIYLVSADAVGGATLIQSGTLSTPNGGNVVLQQHDAFLARYWGGGGWDVIAVFPILGRFKVAPTEANSLAIKNNAVTPNTQIDITATEVVMDNTSGGNYYTENYGTCTINMGVTGAGGLDTGVIAANTWYHLYMIGTGSANSCLASTSATAPTLPAGYSFKMRAGAIRTLTAAATLWTFNQRGNRTLLSAATGQASIASGASGTCSAGALTLNATAALTGSIAPSTATHIHGTIGGQGVAQTCLSPVADTSNPPQMALCSINSNAPSSFSVPFTTPLVTSSLYYCGGATSYVWETGWTDAVNAN
jgi:hypothetical protein